MKIPPCLIVTVGLFCLPFGTAKAVPPQAAQPAQNNNAAGNNPNPPGHAHGLRRRLPEVSSSAGVARGDFNGDGFADLATGVPLEDITVVRRLQVAPFIRIDNEVNAGAVSVIYGSSGGLTATNNAVPASQIWTQETADVLGTSNSGEGFGSGLPQVTSILMGFPISPSPSLANGPLSRASLSAEPFRCFMARQTD